MPLRIMIVEDEQLIALDLQDILESAGHTVVGHATTMRSAVKLAGKSKPDVALMDMELKDGSNGMDAAQAISDKFGVPELFLTARSDFMVRAMAMDVEPVGFVTKPYQPNDLLTALQHVK